MTRMICIALTMALASRVAAKFGRPPALAYIPANTHSLFVSYA